MKYRKQLSEHEINAIAKFVVESSTWVSENDEYRVIRPRNKSSSDVEVRGDKLHPEEKRVSVQKMDELQKFAISLWKKYGIDLIFTKHFLERVNHIRNDPPVTPEELLRLFRESARYHGSTIKNTAAEGGIITDITTNLNIPLVTPNTSTLDDLLNVNQTRKKPDRQVLFKSVQRKKDYVSNNPRDDERYYIGSSPEDNYHVDLDTNARIKAKRR